MFLGADGKVVSSVAMVELVDEIARISGKQIVNAQGVRRFGKHSWRSTGAVWLTGAMMIEIMKVQMLARWASPVVTHYTRLAPFACYHFGLQALPGITGGQDQEG